MYLKVTLRVTFVECHLYFMLIRQCLHTTFMNMLNIIPNISVSILLLFSLASQGS